VQPRLYNHPLGPAVRPPLTDGAATRANTALQPFSRTDRPAPPLPTARRRVRIQRCNHPLGPAVRPPLTDGAATRANTALQPSSRTGRPAPSPGTPGEGWGEGDLERRTIFDKPDSSLSRISSLFTLSFEPTSSSRRGCAAARQFFAPCMVHRPCNSLSFHGIRHHNLPRRAHPVRREPVH